MTTWLIDKSALVRLAASPDVAEWAARIERGLVRITTVTGWKPAIPPGQALSCGPRFSNRRCHRCRLNT